MIKKINKNTEFLHFEQLSEEWWQENGKFKILHTINPLRIKLIHLRPIKTPRRIKITAIKTLKGIDSSKKNTPKKIPNIGIRNAT